MKRNTEIPLNHRYKSEYAAWRSMKYRCNNPSCRDYKHYGGRGIKVHPTWLDSFNTFLMDMGPKPSPKHTLERVQVNENYGPENCIWLINVEQSWNRRNSIMLTHNGKTQSLSNWARELGMPYTQIKSRIDQGFSHDRALCPIKYDSKGRPDSENRKILYNGETLTMREASEKSGVAYNTIRSRVSRNLDPISGEKINFRNAILNPVLVFNQ